MPEMGQTQPYQLRHVGVVQAVVDKLAGTSELHQAKAAQDPEVLGDGRITDAQYRRKVAGAQFLAQKDVDEARSSWVGQSSKEGRQVDVVSPLLQDGPRSFHIRGLDASNLAYINIDCTILQLLNRTLN